MNNPSRQESRHEQPVEPPASQTSRQEDSVEPARQTSRQEDSVEPASQTSRQEDSVEPPEPSSSSTPRQSWETRDTPTSSGAAAFYGSMPTFPQQDASRRAVGSRSVTMPTRSRKASSGSSGTGSSRFQKLGLAAPSYLPHRSQTHGNSRAQKKSAEVPFQATRGAFLFADEPKDEPGGEAPDGVGVDGDLQDYHEPADDEEQAAEEMAAAHAGRKQKHCFSSHEDLSTVVPRYGDIMLMT